MEAPVPNVIICGAGVIGATVAYYLTQKGVRPIVLEAVAPACSASGKAGGFLALDWCPYDRHMDDLARTSFEMHEELAETLGIDYGFRRLRTHSIHVCMDGVVDWPPERFSTPGGSKEELPGWVRPDRVRRTAVVGTEMTTAQVHPKQFTEALLQRAQEGGAEVKQATVVGIILEGRRVEALRIKENGNEHESVMLVPDAVVFAMGVWSSVLEEWLPDGHMAKITGQKVHSIVLDDPEHKITADALFLFSRGPEGQKLEPEVYPRANGEVYLCGVVKKVEHPASPDQVTVEEEAVQLLHGAAASISDELAALELVKTNACFMPNTSDSRPCIGRVPGFDNAYVGAGHGCWGILTAPATGLAIAELITDGLCGCLNLNPFHAGRFSRLTFDDDLPFN